MAYNSKFTGQEIDEGIEKARAIPEGGISGKRTCRFVIGTSTAGWTADDCDYLCDGTADDVEINAAIQALPATGGQILILDGTYIITASITIDKIGVTLRGNGTATILQRNWNSSTVEGVITITAMDGGVTVQNIQIRGGKQSYTNTNNIGIFLKNTQDNTITENICNDNSGNGIHLENTQDNTITENICNDNSGNGIHLESTQDSTITENTCNNNYSGIFLSVVDNTTITGNTCSDSGIAGIHLSDANSNNTITGNTCNNNNYYGIYLSSSSDNNTITGNTCNNSSSGIRLSSSSNNTVTGNTCIRGTGQSSDYTSSQYTIYAAYFPKIFLLATTLRVRIMLTTVAQVTLGLTTSTIKRR